MDLLELKNQNTTKHISVNTKQILTKMDLKVSLINVKIKSNKKIASLNIKNQIETSPKTRD